MSTWVIGILIVLGFIGFCILLKLLLVGFDYFYWRIYNTLSEFWSFLIWGLGWACLVALVSMSICWVLGGLLSALKFDIHIPYWLPVPILTIIFLLAVCHRIRDEGRAYIAEEEFKKQEEEQRRKQEEQRRRATEQHRSREEQRRKQEEQRRSQEKQQNRQTDDVLDEIACYVVLGCAPDISDADLKALYHKLVKENHPDRMGPDISPEIREYATKRMKEINEAYSKIKSIRGMK